MKRLLLLLIGLALTVTATAKDYGIFVNGGYKKGNTKMNDLVKDRVDRAKAAFDRRADKESHSATSKDQLCAALDSITCGPGDTITLFFMGHGTKNKFIFSLETNSTKKKITAKELQEKITARVTDCTCEVRVVIFACHSGSFLNELFKDEHIKAVYASCRAGQKSYSDAVFKPGGFEDNGDWADEFVKKWEAANPANPLGPTLGEANRCANDKTPSEFAKKQKPTGWVRGTFQVKAHIETKATSKSKNLKVTFYDPAHLRGKKDTVDIKTIKLAPGQVLTKCTWVTFDASFGIPDGDKPCAKKNPVLASVPVVSTAPTESYIAHVNMDRSGRTICTTILEPNWLACQKRTLRISTGTIDNDVQQCAFITGSGSLSSPGGRIDVSGHIKRFNYCPEVIIKVKSVQKAQNKICGWIVRPLSLRFMTAKKPICIVVPPGERAILDQLKKYQFFRVKLKTNAIGRQHYNGSNFRRVASSEADLVTFDPALGGMVDPAATIPDSEPFFPIIEIANYGENGYTTGAAVDVLIYDALDTVVYNQSVPLPAIGGELAGELWCPDWFPPSPGSYRLEATLNLAGGASDDELRNNSFTYPFVVESGTFGDGWAGEFIDLPLFMEFWAIERLVQAPGVGTGVGLSSDQLGFVHQPVTGDFFVSGFFDLATVTTNNSLGFMARSNTGGPAAMASWMVNGMGNINFVTRANDGANSAPQASAPAGGPGIWLGLDREGDVFSVFISPDGIDWDLVANQTLPGLPDELQVGIASASGADETQPPSQGIVQGIHGFPAGLSDLQPLEHLDAFGLSPSEVQLFWPDVGFTETGYSVRRSDDDGDTFNEIAVLPPDTTTYVDNSLAPATQALYEVVPLTLDGFDDSPTLALGESTNQGLEPWALSNDIGDPYQSPPWGGEPWLFHYFTGANPFTSLSPTDLMQPQVIDGVPYMLINKAPGIADFRLHVELWDEPTNTWVNRHTIFASSPGGLYQLDMSSDGFGRGLHRVMIEPH